MIVRPFRENDYPELVDWYLMWEETCPPLEMLPKNGFIIPGMCAGFLYLTDSILGIIDLYISNPAITPYVRHKFLDVLTTEIINCAKQKGCKALMATSAITAIKKRSESHGFKYVGDTSVYTRGI